MLNEMIEFEQYTYPLNVEHPVIRLKHKALCNQLSGTARAMTIIARKSIFDYNGPEGIIRAKNDLRVWCGDTKGDPGTVSDKTVNAWLPSYMSQVLGEEKALEFEDYLMKEPGLKAQPRYEEVCSLFKDVHANLNIEVYRTKNRRDRLMNKAEKLSLFCKELGSDNKQRAKTSSAYAPVYNIIKALNTLNGRYSTNGYNKKMFDDKLARTEMNDFKKISYDRIIADAIAAGPLKRFYLVCENADFSGISVKTEKRTSYPFAKKRKGSEWSGKTMQKADLIMKAVAAFLLEQEARNSDNPYGSIAPVNLTDISNWMNGKTGTDALKAFEIESNPLVTFDKSIKNVTAIGINAKWMQHCGWKIVSEESLDDYLANHPDANFYSDFGAGNCLRKGIRY